jgi:hypothetical protein
MENGEWRMENGEWRMENGEWRMEKTGARAHRLKEDNQGAREMRVCFGTIVVDY